MGSLGKYQMESIQHREWRGIHPKKPKKRRGKKRKHTSTLRTQRVQFRR